MTTAAASRAGSGGTLRCQRCERPSGLERRALRAGLRLCDECVPRFESALAAWLTSTAGARDDAGSPLPGPHGTA